MFIVEEGERSGSIWLLTLLGLAFCTHLTAAGECRGSEVNSTGRSWIEATRPLPAGNLDYIAARFCRPRSILVQIWNPVGSNKYELIWQIELEPNAQYMGQVQVFEVTTPDKPILESSYRYGIKGKDVFPVDSIFDSTGRTGRVSVTSVDEDMFQVRETREFTEITRPTYFDVWFCQSRECPSEEELLSEYEVKDPPAHTDDNTDTDKEEEEPLHVMPPDSCKAESLHAPMGQIMLEEHTILMPMVARAVEYYLCDDTVFHIQLWKLMTGRLFRLIWRKAVMPDENSGGGSVHRLQLEEEEVIYLTTEYKLALHVPDENKRIPIPTEFSHTENVVFSMTRKEQFHRCDTQTFEKVAFPYNFRLRFCSKVDCSDRDKIWTADEPLITHLDVLPNHECPPIIHMPNKADNHSSEQSTKDYRDLEDTTSPQQNNDTDTHDTDDINRTKPKQGNNIVTDDNNLALPGELPKAKKATNRANLLHLHDNILSILLAGCMTYWIWRSS